MGTQALRVLRYLSTQAFGHLGNLDTWTLKALGHSDTWTLKALYLADSKKNFSYHFFILELLVTKFMRYFYLYAESLLILIKKHTRWIGLFFGQKSATTKKVLLFFERL